MKQKLTIGVALCTYNGERYLPVQLESIAHQSRRPDSLVVCDDGSKDNTNELLKVFAAGAEFPVFVFRNEVNLGYLRNFESAIERCDADVIVLSDQDDYWRSDKLQILENVFMSDPYAAAVFSDAQIVDERLENLGYTLLDAVKVSAEERRAAHVGNMFPLLLRRNIVCGATLAFRASWKDRVLPFPDGAIHDEWISLVVAAHDAVRFIPDALIRYRQHGANQIGLPSPSRFLRFRNLIRRQARENRRRLSVMRALQSHLIRLRTPSTALDVLAGKIAHLQRRLDLPSLAVKRFRVIADELLNGQYARYSSGWLSAARDLILPMR